MIEWQHNDRDRALRCVVDGIVDLQWRIQNQEKGITIPAERETPEGLHADSGSGDMLCLW